MTTREEFLKHISGALGRDSAPAMTPKPPTVPDDLVRLVPEDADADTLAELWTTHAEKVGMHVRRVTSGELTDAMLALLGELEVKRVTIAAENLPDGASLCEAMREAGVELVDWGNDRTMAAHYDVDAGVSGVDVAVAETGSLICCSGAASGRGLSLVPPLHVAVLRKSQIVPDLLDYLRTRRDPAPADLPSAQAIITGPSKTADIEGVLIQGVHGPAEVHILLVSDA